MDWEVYLFLISRSPRVPFPHFFALRTYFPQLPQKSRTDAQWIDMPTSGASHLYRFSHPFHLHGNSMHSLYIEMNEKNPDSYRRICAYRILQDQDWRPIGLSIRFFVQGEQQAQRLLKPWTPEEGKSACWTTNNSATRKNHNRSLNAMQATSEATLTWHVKRSQSVAPQ